MRVGNIFQIFIVVLPVKQFIGPSIGQSINAHRLSRVSHLDYRIKHVDQNFFGNPACLRAALAVCRDLIELSTTNLMPVIGLNQIS